MFAVQVRQQQVLSVASKPVYLELIKMEESDDTKGAPTIAEEKTADVEPVEETLMKEKDVDVTEKTEKMLDQSQMSTSMASNTDGGSIMLNNEKIASSNEQDTNINKEMTPGSDAAKINVPWQPDMPMPMPLPQVQQQPDPVSEIPGAHAVGGHNPTRDYAPRPQIQQPPRVPPVVVAAQEPPSNAGLAEAHAVEDVDEEIGQAEPVAEGEEGGHDPNREPKSNAYWAMGLVSVLFLLVIVTVSVKAANSSNNTEVYAPTPVPTESPTNNPTAAPTRLPIPWTPFLEHLPNYTLEVLELNDASAPQSQAYQWMLEDPNLNNYTLSRQLQRFALSTFYHATNGTLWERQRKNKTEMLPQSNNNTTTTNSSSATSNRQLQFDIDGPRPYLFYRGFPIFGCRRRRRLQPPQQQPQTPPQGGGGPSSSSGFQQADPFGPEGCRFGGGSQWLEYGTDECDWFNQNDYNVQPTCINGTLAHLYLSRNGLQGTLPKELALLTGMRRFFIETNAISGTIPTELYEGWSNIKDVWLRANQLTGSIATNIGLWRDTLERFNLYGNDMNGAMPAELYQLTQLKMLALLDNRFTETFQLLENNTLVNLRIAGWAGNDLTGSIPPEWGRVSNLFNLALENNRLTGTIPSELGLWRNMEYLTFGNNDLEGSVPSELGRLSTLTLVLSLRGNAGLTGTIPTELGAIPIQNIFLQGTSITGTIPDLWCNATTLKFDCSETLCGCDACPCGET